jgi:methyl-accepting chemotaxis protein
LKAFRNLLGVVLIATAIVGILFGIVALAYTWKTLPIFTQNTKSSVVMIGDALKTTSDGLVVVDSSLTATISSFTKLESTVVATAQSIDDSTPMVETLVLLAKEDLPATVSSAQLSLVAAQDSAEIIDSILRFLAGLPFVPQNLYNPPVPLHVALADVSGSLESIPPALETIEISLSETSENMEVIQADITLIATDIHDITVSMESAQDVIEEYQTLITDLQIRVDRVENNLAGWLNGAALILTFLLIWMIITQIGLLIQGLSMLGYHYYE